MLRLHLAVVSYPFLSLSLMCECALFYDYCHKRGLEQTENAILSVAVYNQAEQHTANVLSSDRQDHLRNVDLPIFFLLQS